MQKNVPLFSFHEIITSTMNFPIILSTEASLLSGVNYVKKSR